MRARFAALALALAACGGGDAGVAGRPPQDSSGSEMGGMARMQGMDMGMEAVEAAPIQITSRQAGLAGVTYAIAREAPLDQTVRAVAMVVPNERGLGIVNARVSGWVEKLYANETGQLIRTGEPLLALYSPDLVTAQEEYLLARRLSATAGGDSLVEATRRRLRLWNIADEDLSTLEQTGEVTRLVTIRSPYPGYIFDKGVVEGQMVRAGDRLFQIADLSTVWIEPAIFEQDIALVRPGQRATVTFDALPGRRFQGQVTFLAPQLDMRTRTLRVRVELPNPGLEIKPMMYGAVAIQTRGPRGVVVPLTAVLPTGQRHLAFIVRGGGVVPTEVSVGARGDSSVVIVRGLAPGDTVVAAAAFLFDSESSLAAAMQGIMLNMGMGLEMGGMGAADMQGIDMPGDTPEPSRAPNANEMKDMKDMKMPGVRP